MNVPVRQLKKEGAVKHIPIYFLFFSHRRSKSILSPLGEKKFEIGGGLPFEHPLGKHLTQQSQVRGEHRFA
jgi:hypothetical protein